MKSNPTFTTTPIGNTCGDNIHSVVAFFGDGELLTGIGHGEDFGILTILPGKQPYAVDSDRTAEDVDPAGVGIWLGFRTVADVERVIADLRLLVENFPIPEATP